MSEWITENSGAIGTVVLLTVIIGYTVCVIVALLNRKKNKKNCFRCIGTSCPYSAKCGIDSNTGTIENEKKQNTENDASKETTK